MLIKEVRGSGSGGSGVGGSGVDGWGADESGRVVGGAGTDGVGSGVLVGFAAVSASLLPSAQAVSTTISAAVIRAGATAMSPP